MIPINIHYKKNCHHNSHQINYKLKITPHRRFSQKKKKRTIKTNLEVPTQEQQNNIAASLLLEL